MNGRVTITVNMNAEMNGKSIAVYTLSHELTHFIHDWSAEKFKTFSEFVIKNWSEAGHGETAEALINARMEQGLDYDTAVEEFVAECCERFLLDGNALQKMTELAQKDSNLVKRMIANIKAWVKKLRDTYANTEAQSRESAVTQTLDKLDEIRTMWEDALDDAARNYRASGEGAVSENGVRNQTANEYADYDKPITMQDVETLRTIADRGRISVNEFTREDLVNAQKWAYKYYQELGNKSPFFRAWFGEWRENSTGNVSVAEIPQYVDSNDDRKANRGTYKNADTRWNITVSREGETNTISHAGKGHLSEYGLSGIRSLVENGVLLDSEIHEHHSNNKANDFIAFDHKLYALGTDENGAVNLYKITVEEYYQSKSETNNKRFHNLRYIKKVAEVSADALAGVPRSGGSTMRSSTTDYSISDLYSLVKRYDKDFHAGRSVSPALLNEDGTPKVFYHGTDAQFTVFDKARAKSSGLYGKGFYFSESSSQAGVYGNQMAVFLSIQNPLVPGNRTITKEQIKRFLQAISEDDDYSIENYGTYNVDKIANKITSRDAFSVIQDINATAIGDFGEAINLFNKINGTNYDGIITPTEAVVYDPSQVKSATDNIGTFDRTNPDIRYQRALSESREEYEAARKELKDRGISKEAADVWVYNLLQRMNGREPRGLRTMAYRALAATYDYMTAEDKAAMEQDFKEAFAGIADEVLEGGLATSEKNDRIIEAKKWIDRLHMHLPDNIKGDFPDYAEWRKMYFEQKNCTPYIRRNIIYSDILTSGVQSLFTILFLCFSVFKLKLVEFPVIIVVGQEFLVGTPLHDPAIL